MASIVARLLCAGLVLLLGSYVVGVDSYESGTREVGYTSAFNWWFVYVLPVPAFGYFLAQLLRAVPELIRELAGRGMLLDPGTHAAIDEAEGLRRWHGKVDQIARAWCWAALLFAFGVTAYEWGSGSLRALLHGHCPGKLEVDWSVAHCGKEAAARAANLAFSTAAAALQACFLALLWLLVMVVAGMCEFFFIRRAKGVALRPDVTDDDRRLGFQAFSPFLSYALWASVIAYIAIYLSRLWNVHLNAKGTSFIEDPFAGLPRSLLTIDGDDYSSMALLAGASILLVVCVAAPYYLVRLGAIDARDRHKAGAAPQIASRLKVMEVWPARYPRQNAVLALVLAGVLATVFYRLGVFFGAFAALLALIQLVEIKPRLPRAQGAKVPFWLIAAGSGVATGVVLYVMEEAAAPWNRIVPISAAVVAVVAVFADPTKVYRRLAWGCIGIAGSGFTLKVALPMLGIKADVVRETPPVVGVTLVIGAMFALYIDPHRHRVQTSSNTDWQAILDGIRRKPWNARRVTFQRLRAAIARETPPGEVITALETIALDSTESAPARNEAIEALRRAGSAGNVRPALVDEWCGVGGATLDAVQGLLTDAPDALGDLLASLGRLQGPPAEPVARHALTAMQTHLERAPDLVSDDDHFACARFARTCEEGGIAPELARAVRRLVEGE